MATQAYELVDEIVQEGDLWKWTITQVWNPAMSMGSYELGSGTATTEAKAQEAVGEYLNDWYADRPEYYAP